MSMVLPSRSHNRFLSELTDVLEDTHAILDRMLTDVLDLLRSLLTLARVPIVRYSLTPVWYLHMGMLA
jgi:hypothetical protein